VFGAGRAYISSIILHLEKGSNNPGPRHVTPRVHLSASWASNYSLLKPYGFAVTRSELQAALQRDIATTIICRYDGRQRREAGGGWLAIHGWEMAALTVTPPPGSM